MVVAVLLLVGVAVVLSAVSSAGAATGTVAGSGAGSGGSGVGASSSAAAGAGGAVASGGRAGSAGAASPSGGAAGSGGGAGSGGVFVHVLGRVVRPGLYEVKPGARAVDVVTAAGGFAAEADQAALNLARPVSDGEQIVVPKVGEPAPAAGAGSASGAGTSTGGTASGTPATAETPVDLNTADAATLETLSGVGPATATAILAWRDEHGRFESVEDLLDVTGIGEKKLDSLRDLVVVR